MDTPLLTVPEQWSLHKQKAALAAPKEFAARCGTAPELKNGPWSFRDHIYCICLQMSESFLKLNLQIYWVSQVRLNT